MTEAMQKAQSHAEWLLIELERECLQFLELRNQLAHELTPDAREELEGKLYAQIVKLESSAEAAIEGIDRATEAEEDE